MDTTKALISAENLAPWVKSVNYFTAKPGSCWGPRVIQEFELILIVSGNFGYRSADKQLMLEGSQVLCIPPGIRHTFYHVKDSAVEPVISCIHLEPDASGNWLRGSYQLSPEPELVTKLTEPEIMKKLFRHCLDGFHGLNRYRSAIASCQVKEIWLRLAEHWRELKYVKQISPRLRDMLAYLENNLEKSPGRRELAKHFGITPEHVNYLFKQELGTSPTQYRREFQVRKAQRLIMEGGLSAKEAAAVTGFSDAFYFSKVFKEITGICPSSLRRR